MFSGSNKISPSDLLTSASDLLTKVLMAQRPSLSCLFACLLLALAWPVSAAEAPALDVQTWRMAPGLHDGWMVRSAVPMAAQAWTTFADLSYTRAPLRFSASVDGAKQRQTVIGDLGMLQLGGAAGLPGGWQVGAVLPMAGMIRGGGPDLVRVDKADAPAFGDLRLETRKALVHRQNSGMATDLAAAAIVGLPTAAKNVWLGGTPSLGLEVLGSLSTATWQADADLGVRLQSTQTLAVQGETLLRAGSTLALRAGAARALLDGRVHARAELQMLAPIASALPSGQTVFDLAVGGDFAVTDALRLYAAVGGAPTSGPGSAAFRAAVGIRFDPQQLPHDADNDGLDDKLDKCPNQAEDKDGFEDQDGCPDPDNDGDGLADLQDKCPNAPEDKDGVQDEDGCPDPDNDGDGLRDVKDKCPDQAEDRDGFDDDDGCPEADNDQDGIPDLHDLCPLSPENKNGFEDEDGCPDMAPGQGKVPEAPATAPGSGSGSGSGAGSGSGSGSGAGAGSGQGRSDAPASLYDLPVVEESKLSASRPSTTGSGSGSGKASAPVPAPATAPATAPGKAKAAPPAKPKADEPAPEGKQRAKVKPI